MRALTLALLTCLGIDFSNPLLPGVVRFGEDESIHALMTERSRTDERPARVLPRLPEPSRVDLVVTVPRPGAGYVDQLRLPSAPSRPRATIDSGPRATTAAEDA